jgi:hypothetical protein
MARRNYFREWPGGIISEKQVELFREKQAELFRDLPGGIIL